MLIILAVLYLFCISNVKCGSGDNFTQVLELFDSTDQKGESIRITKATPLMPKKWIGKARSACSVGIWLFYGSKNYNNYIGNFLAPYRICYDFDVRNSPVSTRFVGDPTDWTKDTITFYDGNMYCGKAETYREDAGDIHLNKLGSFIITGNTEWTIFEWPYHTGKHYCVKRKDLKPNQPLFTFNAGVNKKWKSVKMGCIPPKKKEE